VKVLITGGAGFIGFHLAKHLADEAAEVTVCDNLFRGQMDKDFTALIRRNNVNFINIDLTERKELDKLGRDYDVTYHLAAINGTKYFYEVPEKVLQVNILSLINILDWFTNASCKKIVWTSSSETYAGTMSITELPVPTPEEVPLTITDVFNPRFSYAGSKIAGELLAINYSRAYGLNVSIVRPHNIYGPRMGYEHVIPQFIRRIIDREDPFKVYGGMQSRAFCYIDDFVRGVELLGKLFENSGQPKIVNIGNDKEEIIILDLARRLFDLSDFHPELDISPAPEGSVDRRCPDIFQARTILGYEPKIDLDTGLRKTYDWYLKQDTGQA